MYRKSEFIEKIKFDERMKLSKFNGNLSTLKRQIVRIPGKI